MIKHRLLVLLNNGDDEVVKGILGGEALADVY